MSEMKHNIERLRGSENFEDWKFSVEAYLQMKGLWKAVSGTETDATKLLNAKSELILLVERSIYPHIRQCNSAKEVWDSLQRIFQDSGLMRRVGLIQKFCSTKLNDFSRVDEYVNDVLNTSCKLRSAGLNVDEEWVGSMLLAGLPDEYKPMIMGSGVKITGDSIKMKLLQDVKTDHGNDTAFIGKNWKSPGSKQFKGPKCYNCNEFGHIAAKCPKKNKISQVKKKSAMFSSFSVKTLNKDEWYFDSGASAHMCSNSSYFSNKMESMKSEVIVANNSKIEVKGIGKVDMKVSIGKSKENEVEFLDVLHVPDLCINLLSVSKIVQRGFSMDFSKNGCLVKDNKGNIVATADLVNEMFRLNRSPNQCAYAAKIKETNLELWHERIGHPSSETTKLMVPENVKTTDVDGAKVNCITCLKGKMARQPFKAIGTRAEAVLDLIHTDLCGPMNHKSIGGSLYMLLFIDDYSRKVYAYFIKSKSEVAEKFLEFKTFVENQTSKKIKALRSDNGKEYCNWKMKKILVDGGIQHQTTVPYSPQQNGLVERMNRTVTEKVRCLLIGSGLEKRFWAEAAHTAVYLINRTPCKGIQNKSPEELWSGKRPNLEHLRVFGCQAVIHIPKEKRKKLDAKGRDVVFIGYCTHSRSYRFFDTKKKEVVISRDAAFFEHNFPKKKEVNDDSYYEIFEGCDSVGEENEDSIHVLNERIPTPENEETDSNSFTDAQDDSVGEESSEGITSSTQLRRSTRPRNAPVRDGYVSYIATNNDEDPKTVADAMKSTNNSRWKEAMNDEYSALIKNGTWDLVELPKGKKPINCKWTFKTKRDMHGEIEKYKARLVIKGYSQRQGIDYQETFSPVVRYTSIRLLLSLAVRYNLDIDQMDVVTAFLQSELEEEVYMKPPEGFDDVQGKVCKLKKSLYGLKQASRVWNKKLDATLKKIGLSQSKTDPCIYYETNGEEKTFVAIYVDDILIFTNNKDKKSSIKDSLAKSFEMKDFGEAKFVLGMQITRDREKGKLWIDQEPYIKTMLKRFNMDDCNSVSTPMDINQKLIKETCPKTKEEIEYMNTVPYQEAIGSILYAAQVSRPDLSFAVGALSRFNNNPSKSHWAAVKRLFRYVKGTKNYKLEFTRDDKGRLEGFSDADWASDEDDRKSTTGYIFKYQGGPISWNAKKQPTVALSTTEAEYMALASTSQEALWLQSLLKELTTWNEELILRCDNKSAINLSQDNMYHARSKHIDIRHHFIRDLIDEKKIKIEYLKTEDMLADVMTKGLPAQKHNHCCNLISIKVPTSSGGVEI